MCVPVCVCANMCMFVRMFVRMCMCVPLIIALIGSSIRWVCVSMVTERLGMAHSCGERQIPEQHGKHVPGPMGGYFLSLLGRFRGSNTPCTHMASTGSVINPTRSSLNYCEQNFGVCLSSSRGTHCFEFLGSYPCSITSVSWLSSKFLSLSEFLGSYSCSITTCELTIFQNSLIQGM